MFDERFLSSVTTTVFTMLYFYCHCFHDAVFLLPLFEDQMYDANCVGSGCEKSTERKGKEER